MQLGSVKNCRLGVQMNKKQELNLKIGTSNEIPKGCIDMKTGRGIL